MLTAFRIEKLRGSSVPSTTIREIPRVLFIPPARSGLQDTALIVIVSDGDSTMYGASSVKFCNQSLNSKCTNLTILAKPQV